MSVWFGGFGPAGVTLTYEAVNTEADRVSFVTRADLLEISVIEADEGWYRFGDRIVLDIQAPEEVAGQDVFLRVTAALHEQTWSHERLVRVVDHE